MAGGGILVVAGGGAAAATAAAPLPLLPMDEMMIGRLREDGEG